MPRSTTLWTRCTGTLVRRRMAGNPKPPASPTLPCRHRDVTRSVGAYPGEPTGSDCAWSGQRSQPAQLGKPGSRSTLHVADLVYALGPTVGGTVRTAIVQLRR